MPSYYWLVIGCGLLRVKSEIIALERVSDGKILFIIPVFKKSPPKKATTMDFQQMEGLNDIHLNN